MKPSSGFGSSNCFLQPGSGEGAVQCPPLPQAPTCDSIPVAEHDHVRHGGVRGAGHLAELRGQGAGASQAARAGVGVVGVDGAPLLTRLLWRACSSVAMKRKQRQGTPASRAHCRYLRGRGSVCSCPPTPAPAFAPRVPGPAGGVRVRVVNHNPLSLLQCGCAGAHTALPGAQCVLGGHQGQGEHWGRGRGTGGAGVQAPAYPVDVDVAGRYKVLHKEGGLPGCGARWFQRKPLARGQGTPRVQGLSPPGNPTATTTSGLELRRALGSGWQSGPEGDTVLWEVGWKTSPQPNSTSSPIAAPTHWVEGRELEAGHWPLEKKLLGRGEGQAQVESKLVGRRG